MMHLDLERIITSRAGGGQFENSPTTRELLTQSWRSSCDRVIHVPSTSCRSAPATDGSTTIPPLIRSPSIEARLSPAKTWSRPRGGTDEEAAHKLALDQLGTPH